MPISEAKCVYFWTFQTYAPFYNNRGAVNLKIGNFHAAITDSSAALDLLTPPCEGNASQRAKAYLRRGKALECLELWDKAVGEYEAAAKILPDNQAVQSQLNNALENLQ